MAQQGQKPKKVPPTVTLPNKQIMPLIGFGTYKIKDEQLLTDLLRKGLQIGFCKHIDTARYYNNQIPLGKAIKTVIQQGRCKRDDLFIATKTFNHKDFNPVSQLKQALHLMQLKYVDIYYLHWPLVDIHPVTKQWLHLPLRQFWPLMEQCVKKGYTKHLGVSNFNGQLLQDLLSFATIKPVAVQNEIHPYLQCQSFVQLAQKNNVTVIAHSPLTNATQQNGNVLKDETILEISGKHSKTPAQIVLRSTIQRGVGVIPKTGKVQRLAENFGIWNFELTQDDMKKIKNISKKQRYRDGGKLFPNFSVFDD